MKLQPAIPIFRIFDYVLAKKFYLEWLGFSIDWEHGLNTPGPRYLQISRGGAVLHLTEHHGDCCPGEKAFVALEGLEELHRDLCSRSNPNMNPVIQDAPWLARVIEVTDPFGNRVCFSEAVWG